MGYPGDGRNPHGGPTVAANGIVYGTTTQGSGHDDGTAYALAPPAHAPASAIYSWNETIIHSFSGSDGVLPYDSLILDQRGNPYGVTEQGGAHNGGVVYQLVQSGGAWTQNVLYNFCQPAPACPDGGGPVAALIFDSVSDLYGTTAGGGASTDGVVYQLSNSGSGWTEQVLHSFNRYIDGSEPAGSLIFDQMGNLYGTTSSSGPNGGGTVFELMPSNNGWHLSLLYALTGTFGASTGPYGGLLFDRSGNLWGTTNAEGTYGYGNIFKLAPSQGGWIYTDVYDFTGGDDGGNPNGSLIADTSGNLYGTAVHGGTHGFGVVFELTP